MHESPAYWYNISLLYAPLLSPLHDVTCCEYIRFPTSTPHQQAKSRRRTENTHAAMPGLS